MANKKILIIEDDPDVSLGMHVRLRVNNYDTSFASDALTAVAEARRQNPDLILLDLGLPGGDGFVVIERLKRLPAMAVIPIIVVSGRDARANQARVIKAGATAFLQKPVDNAKLLTVIRQALNGPLMPEAMESYELS